MSTKTSQNNVNMLDELQQINSQLAATGTNKPPTWDTWPKEKKLQYIQQMQQGIAQTRNLTNTLDKNNQNEQQSVQDMAQQGVQPLDAPQQVQAKRTVFNLKRFGQALPPAAPMPHQTPQQVQTPPPNAPADQTTNDFSTVDGLKQALNSFDGSDQPEQSAIQMLESNFVNDKQMITDENNQPSDPKQLIRDAVRSYYSTPDDAMKTKAATVIYENILPDSVKGQSAPIDDEVPGQLETNVKPNLANIIQRSNEAIKKLAEDIANKTPKKATTVFNLKKHSQLGTINDVVMYGPNEKTVDQFNWDHQPISDWHLVERNKGYGLRLPGVSNIDWERAWRENVMDKYTVPFRDKDGNWGGGYIDERFEVDRNIPAQTNMQLKPGQLRKPILPEYGNTESRLEAERTKLNSDRGYKPSEKGEPFNWKKAQIAKKKITAQSNGGLKPLPAMGGFDGSNKKLNTEPTWTCPSCNNEMSRGGQQQCEKCKQRVVPLQGPPQQAPDSPGRQQAPQIAIQPNQQLSPGQQRVISPRRSANADPIMLKNAIFFDSDEQAFVVYAGTDQKKQFSSFDEAEKYAQSIIPPQPTGQVPNPGRGFRPKVLAPVAPQPQPAPASTNPVAAPNTGGNIPPAAGRIPNRKANPRADIDEAAGTDPRHHQSAHGLAIDG